MLALSCPLPAPRSDLEMRIQVHVVYLGDDPRKHWWEMGGGKGGQSIKFHSQASYHCGYLELSPAWTSGNFRHIPLERCANPNSPQFLCEDYFQGPSGLMNCQTRWVKQHPQAEKALLGTTASPH